MSVTIAEELLLLAHSEEAGKQLVDSTSLNLALGGALLAELALGERIDLEGRHVVVKDPTPLGDGELDRALARIVEETKPRKPDWWVNKLHAGKLRDRLLTRLADAGVLTEQQGKVLGIFPSKRWPEADGTVEAGVRERIASALGGSDPDPRTAVLVAVMHAVKLERKAFPGADKKRIKEIAEGEWAGAAVARTIASIQAAIMAGAVAAVVAAGAS
ncbi:GOLPH3/VPS74 family protein [Nonomuraea soli]|uniref:GPP34 family phosphoprotein n=1 Tax=Nonomuraea soli TaxID=1032476 RepID=A0A7W0HQ99_9ACTN|nr:GPP34 family phosphoprotein [Nonomuraea soli]MBA2891685.1 hypothetical protein [Nonomuraea soli]